MIQPEIIANGGDCHLIRVPIASATEIEVGDFISYESNLATLLDAAGDSDTFAGIAASRSTNGDTTDLEVWTKCVIYCDTTSATYTIGQGLTYTSENALVDDSDADTLAWSLEYGTTKTRLKVLIDVINIGDNTTNGLFSKGAPA